MHNREYTLLLTCITEDGPLVTRLTRLTLVCEVIRYRLVEVRQNLKKGLFGLAARNRLSLSLPLSFSSSSYFLSFSKQKMNASLFVWSFHKEEQLPRMANVCPSSSHC